MRTFGIEEEFIFLTPATLQPANVGDEVHGELLGRSPVSRFISHEFLASQIARSTPVFDRFEQASADLLAFRTRLARAALRCSRSAALKYPGPDAVCRSTRFSWSGWRKRKP